MFGPCELNLAWVFCIPVLFGMIQDVIRLDKYFIQRASSRMYGTNILTVIFYIGGGLFIGPDNTYISILLLV